MSVLTGSTVSQTAWSRLIAALFIHFSLITTSLYLCSFDLLISLLLSLNGVLFYGVDHWCAPDRCLAPVLCPPAFTDLFGVLLPAADTHGNREWTEAERIEHGKKVSEGIARARAARLLAGEEKIVDNIKKALLKNIDALALMLARSLAVVEEASAPTTAGVAELAEGVEVLAIAE